jgi:catechol 2,3-dioxygenase-like lactoylglutathione lyase family enzyme
MHNSLIPNLMVSDVNKTALFYQNILGFKLVYVDSGIYFILRQFEGVIRNEMNVGWLKGSFGAHLLCCYNSISI